MGRTLCTTALPHLLYVTVCARVIFRGLFAWGVIVRGYCHTFTFHIFIESKRKNSSKRKHKKTEQRNNVEHKAIILKDKRQKKPNTFLLSHVSMGYQIQ